MKLYKTHTLSFPITITIKNRNKLSSGQRKTDTCRRGIEEKEENIVVLLTFKALKWNVFTVTAYKDVVIMRRVRQSATNQYQFIYLSIYQYQFIFVIDDQYQSITARIFAIDWSSIINQSIDIDSHRLDAPGWERWASFVWTSLYSNVTF